MSVISSASYVEIAELYANARANLTGAVQYFWDAVEVIVLLDEVQPTLDLLGAFHSAYLINEARLTNTSNFDSAVRAINNHVLREGGATDGDGNASVDAWLVDEAVTVPQEWADLSSAVGFTLTQIA